MPLTGNNLEGFRFLSLCSLLCFFCGFRYISLNLAGQQKKKKARYLEPFWAVSGDTGL